MLAYAIQDEGMHEFNSLRGLVGEDSLVDGLYRRHAPAIFAFLCQHTASREDAEDLLLEISLFHILLYHVLLC